MLDKKHLLNAVAFFVVRHRCKFFNAEDGIKEVFYKQVDVKPNKVEAKSIVVRMHNYFKVMSTETRLCGDAFELTSHLPLNLLLGLPYGEEFSCILPHHEDNTPSACINQL